MQTCATCQHYTPYTDDHLPLAQSCGTCLLIQDGVWGMIATSAMHTEVEVTVWPVFGCLLHEPRQEGE